MADKSFGVKQINLIGPSGSIPTIESPGNLNLNANTVAISTDVTIGGEVQSNLKVGSSYSVGIGTTYTSYKLDVIGRVRATNDIDLDSTTGALNLTGRPDYSIGGNYPIVNISHPTGGSLYALYGWQDTGNDRVYQQLSNSTDYFTALGSDSEFIIGPMGAGLLNGSTYSFKIDIDAETSLHYNTSEKLTTTSQGISVTGLTSTTTLNVGSAVSITAETSSGNNDVIYFNPLNESRVSIGINTTLNWSSISGTPDVAFVADKTILGYPKIAIANPTQSSPFYKLRATYSNVSAPYGYVRQDIDNGSYVIALDNSATAFSVGDRSSLDSSRTSNFSSGNEAFVVTLNGSTSLFHSKSKKLETTGYGVTISGGLNVSGVSTLTQLSVNSSTGTNGQYLKATGSGLAWESFPTIRSTTNFNATASQTTFSVNYEIGYIDVYINGIRISDSEFTATNGTSVVLDTPCFGGEEVTVIAYNTTSTGGSFANANYSGIVTATGGFSSGTGSPVQISVIGSTVTLNVAGIGSTTFILS